MSWEELFGAEGLALYQSMNKSANLVLFLPGRFQNFLCQVFVGETEGATEGVANQGFGAHEDRLLGRFGIRFLCGRGKRAKANDPQRRQSNQRAGSPEEVTAIRGRGHKYCARNSLW